MAAHSHSHSHSHGDEATAYFMDQLFAIGACGAIACVTIVLWQSNLLGRMLHPKFHIYVLLGGLLLLTIVTIRAIALWLEAGRGTVPAAGASPDHGHAHSHGEEACQHDHSHGVTAAPPSHSHSHGEEACQHDHGHAPAAVPDVKAPTHGDDHDHSYAPWRYIVLLLPVVLYFLALSNPMFDKEPAELNRPFAADPLPYITTFITIFRSILWEAMPFIVLGAVIAGLLQELLPQHLLASIVPKNTVLAVGLGGLLGIVFPMCECGIVPIMRRLLRKGLPLACCVAYLLAGPIVNVVVLLSTFAAFSGMENVYIGGQPSYQMGGWWMVGFRAGLGYLTAVVTALIVEWQYRKHGDALLTPSTRPVPEPVSTGPRSLWQRMSNISQTSMNDFVDITVFLILGALLAAGVRMFLTPERIADLGSNHALLAILLMMGLAVALCLCSEADAFVAASLVALRPSAKLAFLVLGPMVDIKLYALYTRIFRPRLIFTIFTAVVIQVFVYSAAVHYFWEEYKEQLVSPKPPAGSGQSDEEIAALKEQVARAVGLLLTAPAGWHPLNHELASAQLVLDPNEKAVEMTFTRLENVAQSADLREYYTGRLVWMSGRFNGSDLGFQLIRYKMACCAADATPLRAFLTAGPDTKQFGAIPAQQYQGKWVKVTGRVDFRLGPGGQYLPVILITPTEKPTERPPWDRVIEVIPQPDNPFI